MLFEVQGATGDPTDTYCTNNPTDGGCGSGATMDYGSPTGNGAGTQIGYYGAGSAKYATGIFSDIAPAGSNTPPSSFLALTGRHTDGSNFLFADSHVKWQRGSAVSAGQDNPTANDPGTVTPVAPATGSNGGLGNFANTAAIAANTGNGNNSATFSYD